MTLRMDTIELSHSKENKNGSNKPSNKLSILCFSHLRWDFVFQRPQHLLTHASKTYPVFFIEEPIFEQTSANKLKCRTEDNVTICTPVLSTEVKGEEIDSVLESLVMQKLEELSIIKYISWYYTPMAISFTAQLRPELVVYDCMDELSAFAGAPPQMIENEKILLDKADIVFTGGRSLYEAKKYIHDNVYLFPSSIDTKHYAINSKEYVNYSKSDSANVSKKIGYFGVIDERFDIPLLDEISKLKPEWNFIIVGPVVKISPDILPNRSNIFYTGQKTYEELPEIINSWDAAIIPFARNKSTEYISPTKVLEYLAAGKPVVSTSIRDIVMPYGVNNIVKIADEPGEFVKALESSFNCKDDQEWKNKVNSLLEKTSWSKTWKEMENIIQESLTKSHINKTERNKQYV